MPFISLHGRAFGFDSETGAIIRNGVEGGQGDQAVSAASTASNIAPRGVTTLAATAAKAYTLTAPITGVTKQLYNTASTTTLQTVTLASGTFRTTAGSTFTVATFGTIGQALTLTALSTALFGVTNNVGVVTFST
jgi:hypothetical protein